MKRLLLICLMLFLVCLTGGCGTQEPVNNSVQEKVAYEVIDEAGRKLTFTEKPQRIASLTYGTDEILTDLVGTKRIVGYSRWAGDPEITFITKEQARKVGRKIEENTEAVLSVKPDLVVATTASNNEIIHSLEALGLKVYLAGRPKNYEQMRVKVLKLGEAVGE
ncbi:MAG: ABC transporter substrate-binding protein [Phascolarctobacterium sp.]|nr:ABC transporter substrate-binding protein [Phascolarctobacterium sp.]